MEEKYMGENAALYNDYMYNNQFRNYVDRYAKTEGISVEEALRHALVKAVRMQYTEV